jgi:hypothetical protein
VFGEVFARYEVNTVATMMNISCMFDKISKTIQIPIRYLLTS